MQESEKRGALGRIGARLLPTLECEQVQGAFVVHPAACTIHVNRSGTWHVRRRLRAGSALPTMK